MDTTIVAQARELAEHLFDGKVRRESGKSVFEAHLEPVAQLVKRMNGDDIAIAAAYLHDAVEDVGMHTLSQIEAISPEVAQIVLALTEQGDKSDWKGRKESYLALVPMMDWRSLLVSLSDKAVQLSDFSDEWKEGKFGKRPEDILWFFETLLNAYISRHYSIEEYPEVPGGYSISKNIDGLIHDIELDLDYLRYKYKQAHSA